MGCEFNSQETAEGLQGDLFPVGEEEDDPLDGEHLKENGEENSGENEGRVLQGGVEEGTEIHADRLGEKVSSRSHDPLPLKVVVEPLVLIPGLHFVESLQESSSGNDVDEIFEDFDPCRLAAFQLFREAFGDDDDGSHLPREEELPALLNATDPVIHRNGLKTLYPPDQGAGRGGVVQIAEGG